MKIFKQWLSLSMLLILILVNAPSAKAIQLPGDVRYFYQLVPVTGAPGSFSLYVEKTSSDGMPLHAGSIALAVPPGDQTPQFTPENGWTTIAPQFTSGGNVLTPEGCETGLLADDRQYISFSWHWKQSAGELPGSGEYRQLLGVLTVPQSVQLDSIELLPWVHTPTGAKLMGDWSLNADKEAYQEILYSFWRMPNLNMPEQGYYQGYYADERAPGEEEANQYAVDLTAAWQGFTIGAYAPQKAATIILYKHPEGGGTPTLYAAAKAEFGNGTGYFKGKIDFSSLDFKNPDDDSSVQPTGGVYNIVILKPSHVRCEIQDVQYDETTHIFPLLLGLHVELPCGDLVVKPEPAELNLQRGDGVITLRDRSVLLACLNGAVGEDDAQYSFADLNGDEKVSLADLDILMSAENYNHENIIIKGKGTDE